MNVPCLAAASLLLWASAAHAQVTAQAAFDGGVGRKWTLPDILREFPLPDLGLPVAAAPGRDFAALKRGRCDATAGGPVHRVRKVLRRWNERLDLGPNPRCYGEEMVRAVTLFKAVYGLGQDGRSFDARTAEAIALMEGAPALQEPPRRRQWPGGEILYQASKHLGKPYLLGGDGTRRTDCGMFTKIALNMAGFFHERFTRLADEQYFHAKRSRPLRSRNAAGSYALALESAPDPGNLVFFVNHIFPGSIDGVGHVGFYVGGGGLGGSQGYFLHASSAKGEVTLDELDYGNRGRIPGFGEVRPE